VEVVADDFGLFGRADVFLVAKIDFVVALPGKGDGDGRAADFDTVELHERAGGVAADGDFAFDAAGEGKEGQTKRTEGKKLVPGIHGGNCNVGPARRLCLFQRLSNSSIMRPFARGVPLTWD